MKLSEKKMHLLVLVLLTFFSLISSKSIHTRSIDDQIFSKNGAQFSYNLYTKIAEPNKNLNIAISPYSIRSCSALLYFATTGPAAEELANGLQFGSNDKNEIAEFLTISTQNQSPLIQVANRIYVETSNELREEYKEITSKALNAIAENIDFKDTENAAKIINNYVEDVTNHKITKIINPSEIDQDTSFVLVNAIYFNAGWAKRFHEDNTKKRKFYLSETEFTLVDMMRTYDQFKIGKFSELDATVLELPYNKNDMSMLVFLPNIKSDVYKLEENLKEVNILDLSSRMVLSEVYLKLPKFKIAFGAELTETFKKTGIKAIFEEASQFSELLKVPTLEKVSKIIHKTVIEVSESGTEAAAATYIGPEPVSGLNMDEQFIANRPFIFCIKDKSNIYFIGRYTAAETYPSMQHERL